MPSTVADRLTRGRDFSVGISEQTAYGSINSNPTFTPVRRTTGKPKKTINYVQDDSVTTDNQGQLNIQDTQELTMELAANVSKQSIGWLLQSIHGTEVVTTDTGTDYATTASGVTLDATVYSAIAVGDGFWVTGFADDDNDGFYIVSEKAGANTVTTTIAPATVEAAGASVTFTMRKMKNADDPTYNTLQRRVTATAESGDISYFTLYDAVIDTMSIEIGETGIVTSTANFLAEKSVAGVAAISGQTYAAAPTDRSLSAVQNIEGFYVDNVVATCDQKSITIEVANGYVGDDAAGCVRQYARGQFAVTGSANFRSRVSSPLDWEEYYQSGTTKSLGVRVSHGGGHETFIVMPQCLITEHNQADGSNDVANHEVSFGAEGHTTTASTIMVFRNWS